MLGHDPTPRPTCPVGKAMILPPDQLVQLEVREEFREGNEHQSEYIVIFKINLKTAILLDNK